MNLLLTRITRLKLWTHGTAARMEFVGGAHALAPGPLTQCARSFMFNIVGKPEASDIVGHPDRLGMSWKSKRSDDNYPHNLIHIPIPTVTDLSSTVDKESAFNSGTFRPAEVKLAKVYVYYRLEDGIVFENLFVSDGLDVIYDHQTTSAGDIVSASGSHVDRLDGERDGETRFNIPEPKPRIFKGLNISLLISCQQDSAHVRISTAGAEFWIIDENP